MRAFAHVEKRPIAIEAQVLDPLLLEELLGVFAFVRLTHLIESGHRRIKGKLLVVEPLSFLQNASSLMGSERMKS